VAGPVATVAAGDERLAPFLRLTGKGARQRVEQQLGVFVAEGHLALAALVASPYQVLAVAVIPAQRERVLTALAGTDAPVYVVDEADLAATTGFAVHRGVVGLGRRPPPEEPAALLAAGGPIVVAEGIGDHENLGGLFRNAAAFGVGAVLLDPSCADPLYRRSVRVSLGHVLRVPFARFSAWPAGLARLRSEGYEVVALTPGAGEDVAVLDTSPRHRTALLVGAEGPGLSVAALAAADRRVRIPLAAGVDSLNLATAAAIALHRLVGPTVARWPTSRSD
jgi:tRNA G18 (ribose-2'-O)-methylase SpoU